MPEHVHKAVMYRHECHRHNMDEGFTVMECECGSTKKRMWSDEDTIAWDQIEWEKPNEQAA